MIWLVVAIVAGLAVGKFLGSHDGQVRHATPASDRTLGSRAVWYDCRMGSTVTLTAKGALWGRASPAAFPGRNSQDRTHRLFWSSSGSLRSKTASVTALAGTKQRCIGP